MSLRFIENTTPLGAREKVMIYMSNWVKKNKLKMVNLRLCLWRGCFRAATILPWLLFLYWKLSYTVKPTSID